MWSTLLVFLVPSSPESSVNCQPTGDFRYLSPDKAEVAPPVSHFFLFELMTCWFTGISMKSQLANRKHIHHRVKFGKLSHGYSSLSDRGGVRNPWQARGHPHATSSFISAFIKAWKWKHQSAFVPVGTQKFIVKTRFIGNQSKSQCCPYSKPLHCAIIIHFIMIR